MKETQIKGYNVLEQYWMSHKSHLKFEWEMPTEHI